MKVFRARVWSSFGSCLLGALPLTGGAAEGTAVTPATPVAVDQGGELGGEWGGEGGIHPSSYQLFSPDPKAFDYDARAQQRAYAELVYRSYLKAERKARQLERRIETLLARPSQSTLDQARRAWLAARPAYLLTKPSGSTTAPLTSIPSMARPGLKSTSTPGPSMKRSSITCAGLRRQV